MSSKINKRPIGLNPVPIKPKPTKGGGVHHTLNPVPMPVKPTLNPIPPSVRPTVNPVPIKKPIGVKNPGVLNVVNPGSTKKTKGPKKAD